MLDWGIAPEVLHEHAQIALHRCRHQDHLQVKFDCQNSSTPFCKHTSASLRIKCS